MWHSVYGLDVYEKDTKKGIIKTAITHPKSIKRFERPLIDQRPSF